MGADHLNQARRAGGFSSRCGGNEVAAHKPAPDVYLLALARLGLPAGQAVAVEDTLRGVTAAQAAGLRCIAIPNPHTDPARFGHADLILASAAELSLTEAVRPATA